MDATTFPISFPYHLIFCILAVIVFVFAFVRNRRPTPLILAIAVAASLLIYIDKTNKMLFDAVGWFDVVMLLGALVFSLVHYFSERKKFSYTADVSVTVTTETDPEIPTPDMPSSEPEQIAPNAQPQPDSPESAVHLVKPDDNAPENANTNIKDEAQ